MPRYPYRDPILPPNVIAGNITKVIAAVYGMQGGRTAEHGGVAELPSTRGYLADPG